MQPRPRSLWYPDLPAWPSTGATPAADLAAHLARFRSVDAVQPPDATSSVAVLDAPQQMIDEAENFPGRVPMEVPDRPSSDLDAFLAEAEKSVRERRKAASPEEPAWRRLLRPRPRIAAAAVATVVIAATVAVALSITGGGTERPVAGDTTESVAPTDASNSPAVRVPACAQLPVGAGSTVSNSDDRGDQESGEGAIRAFNYAYYVLRSAKAARAVTAPGAVASEYVMQQYIDQRPVGTEHCLKIGELEPGEYAVTLTELQPDATPITYNQIIRTSKTGGKYFIDSIKAVE
ncbi:hypothetical protein [Gordonia aurantiaca]